MHEPERDGEEQPEEDGEWHSPVRFVKGEPESALTGAVSTSFSPAPEQELSQFFAQSTHGH